MKLRCSSLPLAFACPGSVRSQSGEILLDIVEEGVNLGSAVHEVLATFVSTGGVEVPDVRPYALKHQVEADDVGRLAYYGAQAWRELCEHFPNPLTEQEVKGTWAASVDLSGHIDLVSLGDSSAHLIDWKTGYKESDFYHQVMGYALLLHVAHPELENVRVSIVWLRESTMTTVSLTRAELGAWLRELTEMVVEWDGVYHAGEHCVRCRRFVTCPARQALVRSAWDSIEQAPPAIDMIDQPRDAFMPALAHLVRTGKLALAKQVIDQIDDMIRKDISVNGPLALGNGRELALVPEPRDTIDALKAWPVLQKYLTDEQIAPAVKIGKTAMLEAVGQTVAKGKGKMKDQVMTELKAAGAVTTSTIHKLRERAQQKEIAS